MKATIKTVVEYARNDNRKKYAIARSKDTDGIFEDLMLQGQSHSICADLFYSAFERCNDTIQNGHKISTQNFKNTLLNKGIENKRTKDGVRFLNIEFEDCSDELNN